MNCDLAATCPVYNLKSCLRRFVKSGCPGELLGGGDEHEEMSVLTDRGVSEQEPDGVHIVGKG